MELSQLQHNWAARGFSCTLWEDPPGQVWRDFVHETDELVTLVAGAIELSFEGQTLRPQIGEEVFIPARARHTVCNIGPTMNRWVSDTARRLKVAATQNRCSEPFALPLDIPG